MSRNLTVQIVIAALLGFVLIASIVQIVQYQTIEERLIEVQQKTKHNEDMLTQLGDKVDRGIKVSGSVSGGGMRAPAVQVAGNILKPDPTPLIAPKAQKGGKLRLASGADFKGFNRLTENGADVSALYIGMVGNVIARRHTKDPNTFGPELAESVVANADLTEFHIKLRTGIMWHKPAVDFANPRYAWLNKDHELTTADFEFMIKMLLDSNVEGAAPRRVNFEAFDRLEILGPHEMKVHWKKKFSKAVSVTLEYIFPMPHWLYGYDEDGSAYAPEIVGTKLNSHWYNDRAIGTGPYRFIESKTGEHVKLTRNENYFGTLPAIKDVSYKIIKDAESRLLQFKKGELDVLGLNATQYKREILDDEKSLFNTGKLKYDTYTGLGYYYLGWNGDGPFFKDKRVRRAMTHAFNRQKILSEVFHGLGYIITGNFYMETPYYNKALVPLAFDLEKAKALLDEAGWKDSDGDGVREKEINGAKTRFEFNILIYSSSQEYKTLADIFKEDLIKIGVKMNISPVDWPTMQKKMNDKEFGAFTGGWGLDWESDPYQLWHSSQADVPKGSNRVGFRNKEADAIIIKARETTDLNERKKLYQRFHEIVYEEQPYTFFFTPKRVVAWNPSVNNIVFQGPRPQVLYKLMWKNAEQK